MPELEEAMPELEEAMSDWPSVLNPLLRTRSITLPGAGTGKLSRVAKSMLNANPDAYIPEFISLGAHHFRIDMLEKYQAAKDIRTSSEEHYKFKSATTLCQKLESIKSDGRRLHNIVQKIQEMKEEIKSFYESSETTDKYMDNLVFMMTVDCLFLLQFIFSHDLGEFGIRIKCDIVKLENQVPLSVLKPVFEEVKEVLVNRNLSHIYKKADAFNSLVVWNAFKKLSPFEIYSGIPTSLLVAGKDLLDRKHLLDCIHAIVSRFVQFQANLDENELHFLGRMQPKPSLFQMIFNFLEVCFLEKMCKILFFSTHKQGGFPIKGYTAGELARAGIKFKSFSRSSHHIQFDEYSNTLYLPRMTVTALTQTEAFFRNLIALEVNNANRGKNVRLFIQLMDALIDSPHDVAKLRKSHVIRVGSALADEALAKIWNSMYQSFSDTLHPEPPEELKNTLDNMLTKKCCIIKSRIVLLELFDEFKELYLSKPWKVVALLVGIFILGMNTIQAYCSLWGCNFSH